MLRGMKEVALGEAIKSHFYVPSGYVYKNGKLQKIKTRGKAKDKK